MRRAYGDSTSTQVNPWKDELLKYSVQPIRQFIYTTGKNSADSALVIDAMDLLHGGMVEGFCLVSSDSDFTRLAQRIREQGLLAYGFGERNPPESLVKACTQFIYVENLVGKEAAAKDTAGASATTEATPAAKRCHARRETAIPRPPWCGASQASRANAGNAPLRGVEIGADSCADFGKVVAHRRDDDGLFDTRVRVRDAVAHAPHGRPLAAEELVAAAR